LTAKDSSEFSTAWSFITQHFGELYSVKENVVELRKTILQLAVMGKLVRQDPNDEPASELLRSIDLEKQRLVKEGKIKKSKPLPKIEKEDLPYAQPNGWKWVRLGEITQIKGGKRVSNGYKLLTTPTPYIYIRVTDMKNGSVDDAHLHFIDEEMHTKIKQYIIHKEDIYMTIVGATIGKCGIIPEKLDGMHLTENAARIILEKSADKLYLLKCLESSFCQKQFIDKTKQVGVQKMALNRLSSTMIPLPPLAEQQRIVEKIDRLMGMCDRLEESIESAKGKQTDLLNALMSQV
jgi:type I restriction enzyme, S subunit